jgi:hypothetical protein
MSKQQRTCSIAFLLGVFSISFTFLGEAMEPTVVVRKGDIERAYSLSEIEALETVTGLGTYIQQTGTEYTAAYTGVPLSTLIGNVPGETTVRVTASDGYSMNYEATMLMDRSEGIWILAYQEDGESMPPDIGPFRIVQVGEDNPHFTSSLSARMVERIEILGIYEPYTLVLRGAVTRAFSRDELEAGIGCPCHTATITVTSEGKTHIYTGLPLWRLVAYADDDRFPDPEKGIHYNDEDFNSTLVEEGYTITLLAEDAYSQILDSTWIAHDDQFIVAFKQDGVFLDPETDGYMLFVYDDAVELPGGARLKRVKLLSEIILDL